MITSSATYRTSIQRTSKQRRRNRLVWHIEITVFSSNRKLHLSIKADGLNLAKQAALQEFRRCNPEKKNLYLEAQKNGVYTIVSNLDDVGEVRFKPYRGD